MDALPQEMLVFSSDFPHFEGISDPVRYYERLLAPVSREVRQRFMGETINEVFRRIGDPLI